MNKLTLVPTLLVLGIASFSSSALTQGERGQGAERAGQEEHGKASERAAGERQTDADKLHEVVRQARADLDALRKKLGISGERGEGRGEHGEGGREGRGEHGEGGREGGGEHGGESSEGEEGGQRMGQDETWDKIKNGARLTLKYNPKTQSFQGVVQNTTRRPLKDVRVEVHLSNGVELGPTKRTGMKPGEKLRVELSAAGHEFTWWTTHPEHGSEEGHGPGHEGERSESRPKDPALRPLYNELLLLRREIRMIADGLDPRQTEKKKF